MPHGASRIAVSEGVRRSELLTARWRQFARRRRHIQIDVRRVIRFLIDKRIRFVVTGAYGIASWTGRARATHDIDLLVKEGRNLTRAINAIRTLYPSLESRPFAGVHAFFIPGEIESVIDVIFPHRADLHNTLAEPVWVEDEGLRYRIPTLEAALANKYGAMLNPTRPLGKRFVDVSDFTFMVQRSRESGRTPIDRAKLAELGNKVWSEGGADEILKLVDLVSAGRGFNLDELIERSSG